MNPAVVTTALRIVAALAVTTLCAVSPSVGTSASDVPDSRGVMLGVLGDANRFLAQTGQQSTIRHLLISWNQGVEWGSKLPVLLESLRPVPMLGLGTLDWRTKREVVNPREIAIGRGDTYLLGLNAGIAEFGAPVYLRPLPEMNNYHRPYCAFDANGRSRGSNYSTAMYRKAFARIAIIVRGGTKEDVNAKLRRLGLPGVQADLPRTAVLLVWNPQGYGSPDLPQNSAQSYYPGDAYVDVVANDLYDQGFNAAWDANERLYAAHPSRPFGIAEWGVWSIDDPSFVERMAAFVRSHGRVEFIAYFSGSPGSPFDLSRKPRSRAAYKKLITPLGTTGDQVFGGPAPGMPPGTVKLPGATVFVSIKPGQNLPPGTIVDVSNGAAVTLADPKGRKAVFYGKKDGVPSMFVMAGVVRRFVELRLTGGDFKVCKTRSVQRAGKSEKPVRRLWGKGKGSFRTKGRYAAAAVRGTWWLTEDYCTRTLVKVKRGVMTVRDLVKKKTVIVPAGKSYSALPPGKRNP
jgi:hypothetical protein